MVCFKDLVEYHLVIELKQLLTFIVLRKWTYFERYAYTKLYRVEKYEASYGNFRLDGPDEP